mmetsp:Transcript_18311/g.30978  ORF Transcript_18311/g.30978 Transcript_18311/m.30978 type:complete len:104 (+) Transcript_18311:47-358(+)
MGCSGSIESIENRSTLPPCKGKELQVVENSKKASFGCKKVSFHSLETPDDERKPSKGSSPEASLQRFLELINANGVILEEKVSRKRRRDFGLLDGAACFIESM